MSSCRKAKVLAKRTDNYVHEQLAAEPNMSDTSKGSQAGAVQDWLKEDRNCWIAIAAAFLDRYEREVAIEKLTAALRHHLRDGPPPADTLGGRLFRAGASKLDYQAIAIEIAVAAESSNPPIQLPGGRLLRPVA
jgi:hypothetical protein